MKADKEKSSIVMLPVHTLHPHPDNPRKVVGNVDELAESIRANGVLQNLTVVPYVSPRDGETIKGLYTVIIGHRRLAAAKQAGLDELPCVIVEMSEKDQLSTMLTENMQRVDLTVYEQAQGFQMMLDLGDSLEEIAGKSGFSKTTVRKRLEMAKLDSETLKKVSSRQLSLTDFDELAKIDDIETRNKVLGSIGTANFKNEMQNALKDQQLKQKLEEWLRVIRTFAEEDPNAQNKNNLRYYQSFDRWHLTTEAKAPEDAETVRYFYRVGTADIVLYKERDMAQEEANKAAREERQRKAEEIRLRYEDINNRHFDLRFDFVKSLTKSACKENWARICGYVADTIFQVTERSGYSRDKIELDYLAELLGIVIDRDDLTGDDRLTDFPGVRSATEAFPEKTMLGIAYILADSESNGYWRKVWNVGDYIYQHCENARLDMLYELLSDLGYEMSDEEKEMQSGDHRIFLPGGDECEEDQNG
jgi:ParB family chromosome partitioning protein